MLVMSKHLLICIVIILCEWPCAGHSHGPGRWFSEHKPVFNAKHGPLGWRLSHDHNSEIQMQFLVVVRDHLAEPMHMANLALNDGAVEACTLSYCSQSLGDGSCHLESIIKSIRTALHVLVKVPRQTVNKFEAAVAAIKPASGWYSVSVGLGSPELIAIAALRQGMLQLQNLQHDFLLIGNHTGECIFGGPILEVNRELSRIALHAAAQLDYMLLLESAASENRELRLPSRVNYRKDLGNHHGEILLSLLQQLLSENRQRQGSSELLVVELGTGKAATTVDLLSSLPEVVVITVDPWLPLPGEDAEHFRQIALNARRSLEPFGRRAIVMQMIAEDAAKLIADATFDLVFVDSGMEREKDLEAWLPKVRRGGIICGHDLNRVGPYYEKVMSSVPPGVTLSLGPDWMWWYNV